MNEAGAAVAAAKLLELYAQPVRHRSRLTHGRETLPGAIHAFRMAQGRFPEGAMPGISAQERARLREAAEFFIRQVCLWDGATHYQVLGVPPDAPRQQIKEHYHALMGLLHPDREDAESGRWPVAAASRVNQAYAVLSDKALRHDYDADLGRAAQAPRGFTAQDAQASVAARTRASARRAGPANRSPFVRAALVGSATIAGLLFLNAWWASDVPGKYATLQSATPLESSWRWMRESMSNASLPRFLASGDHADASPRPFEAPAGAWKPSPEPSIVRASHAETIPAPDPVAEPVRVPEARPPAREAFRLAGEVEAVRPPPAAAPVQAPQPSQPTEASVAELEMLVAQLVSHYEAGNLERFLGLFDPASLGVVEAVGLRNDFEEFFRTTRSRQLSLQAISWGSGSQPARARGEALVRASYQDRPERIERSVAIDATIAWRDGRPRFARLSLYPHE